MTISKGDSYAFSLRNARVRFGTKDLCFPAEAGGMSGIVSFPNVKSTALVQGLNKPLKGQVMIDGKDIGDLSDGLQKQR